MRINVNPIIKFSHTGLFAAAPREQPDVDWVAHAARQLLERPLTIEDFRNPARSRDALDAAQAKLDDVRLRTRATRTRRVF